MERGLAGLDDEAIGERFDGAERVRLLAATDLIEHPKVIRVVALSGGYSRDDANAILARNPGMIASFSRALTEGLTAQQSDDEFNADLDRAIGTIFDASKA